jgi:hypothetical protein
LHSWNIAIGNFFFRYRNALFPLIFATGALVLRPHIMFNSPAVDRILVAAGMVIALFGLSPLVSNTSIAAAKTAKSMPDGWFGAGSTASLEIPCTLATL